MKKGIRLSKDRGLNAKLVVCCRCGKEMNELVLIGDSDYKYECFECHHKMLGSSSLSKCLVCGKGVKRLGRLEEMEKLSGICDECQKEIDGCNSELQAGGVPWRCSICGSEGVIKKHSPIAKMLKESHGGRVGLGMDGCPVCEKN